MNWFKGLFQRELTPEDVRSATAKWQELENEISGLRNTAIILGYAITERIEKLDKLKGEITI